MKPKIITGGNHSDLRGTLRYNREFDSSLIKRLYIIENKDSQFIRGWQGHKIEQRWFSAIVGSFKIDLILIDNWEKPSQSLQPISFEISFEKFDVLHVPKGYISKIQALEDNAKLLVMSDYLLGEVEDDYRFDTQYFNI